MFHLHEPDSYSFCGEDEEFLAGHLTFEFNHLECPHSKRMFKRHLRELSKSFGYQIDHPEKSEELKRTKTDVENNLTRILKLIKSEDQSKKDGNSWKESELVGLIEDFYNQYQSLYALYGRLTGEYIKSSPRRVERVSSLSSSSSDSEYFSSEEIDINNAEVNLNDSNQRPFSPFSRERERFSFLNSSSNNTHDFILKTRASPPTEPNEIEEQLNTQTKEVENLNQQKRNLELQVENQALEVKQLRGKNEELELSLKESKGTVSVLQGKLKNNEDQATTKIADLMARINKLEQEAKTRGKMEEKIKRKRNEALNQKKELTDQLNVMQQNLDSVCNQNKELESQLEKEREKGSQYLVQIENLAEKTSVMLKEKECLLARIKDLESLCCSKQNDLEEQLSDARSETNRLEDEGKALQERNHELERAMTQREEEILDLLREHESDKREESIKVMFLTAEVDDLKLGLNTLQEEKSELESQNEQSQKEYSESLAKMEHLNTQLETQVAEHEETIKKLTETIEQTRAGNKQPKIWPNKLNLNQQFTERKMKELAEEFRKKMEDNIRILHQRIHVAEQLNNENKDSHKMTKQRYEEKNKMLGEKIANYEDEIRMLIIKARETPSQVDLVNLNLNGLELGALNDRLLDLAAEKIDEHRGRVSKMLGEVLFAKDWIKKRRGEMEQLKEKVDGLEALLGDKEEKELLLREKVWKLEAEVSKEGGEKLNLMKTVTRLERKVGKLEKSVKEKDEELVSLGEKKREAIRQLCFLVEFHRDRCFYLRDLMSKTRVRNKT